MAPKAKPTPHRLGPPPQLNSLKVPVVHQKFAKKVQPKLQEVVSRHIKILAKWFHTQFSWKKFLMSWMVLLIASKMVLLMLTYQFFTMTSLVSLEVRPVVIISYFFSGNFRSIREHENFSFLCVNPIVMSALHVNANMKTFVRKNAGFVIEQKQVPEKKSEIVQPVPRYYLTRYKVKN